MKKKRLLILTITRNRKELFQECYHTLRRENPIIFDLMEVKHLIIDNGSEREMSEYLESLLEKHPEYHLLKNKTNEGVTGAMTKGLNWAEKNWQPDYVLKFDPDIRAETKNFLFTAVMINENFGPKYVMAPWDNLLDPNYEPRKLGVNKKFPLFHGEFELSLRTHVGGAMCFMPWEAVHSYMKARTRPVGDMERGIHWRNHGFDVGYLAQYEMSHLGINNQTPNYKL